MTHRLKGEFSFLQVILALALQDHGPLVDGTEVGSTAGGSRVNSSPAYLFQMHFQKSQVRPLVNFFYYVTP